MNPEENFEEILINGSAALVFAATGNGNNTDMLKKWFVHCDQILLECEAKQRYYQIGFTLKVVRKVIELIFEYSGKQITIRNRPQFPTLAGQPLLSSELAVEILEFEHIDNAGDGLRLSFVELKAKSWIA